MKLLRSLAATALLAVLWAAGVSAQNYTGPNYLTMDYLKRLIIVDQDRDRDLHVLTNSGINGQSIGAGVALKSTTPIQLPDYSEIYAQVSFTTTAVADTDSINVEVFFIGKISTSVTDGVDYPFDSYIPTLPAAGSPNDTSLSVGETDGWYITRNTLTQATGANGGILGSVPPIRLFPKRMSNQPTCPQSAIMNSMGVMFPIANNQGMWLHSPYIECVVVNRHPRKAVFVNVDYWPKVR